MRDSLRVLPLWGLVGWGAGCATQPAKKPSSAPSAALTRPEKTPSAPRQEMSLDGEMGVLETEDVEDTMQAHFEDVRSCYGRAGDAQGYAEGHVTLRFLVAGDGRAHDVWVVDSTLGNYDVERCLVEVGRAIAFPAPGGRKPTTFEYPVEFRSTNLMPVLDLDGLKVERDVATFLPELASCGQLTSNSAKAILYIGPDGHPGSVGLSAAAAMDEKVGACMVQIMRKWKMSARLPSSVMRTTFTIPPAIAAAEASPRRITTRLRRR